MSPRHRKTSLLRRGAALAALAFAAARAAANPTGMTVTAGNVSAFLNGANLDISASHNAVINWQSFNIAPGETTTFHQPDNISVVWNRITDQNPSQIWGHLNGNGIVVLMNQSGFYFGPDSCVNVGGFVATSALVTPPASVGGMWSYQGPPPVASIINYGEIKAATGGSIFLVAEKIENHGILTAPDGTLGLYAGKEVLISERPDGRGLSMGVALPDGAIDNFGKISADAGAIALHARVVNQNGFIQADSVREHNGTIELVAGEALNLGANSLITANGGAGVSAGGAITLKSGGDFSDAAGSRIEARGGAAGGTGGAVELSAANLADIQSRVDGAAQTGFTGGTMLIDPTDLTLNNSSLSPYVGFSAITFEATHNITFAANTVWNLSTATGLTAGQLTLRAGNNITFGNAARITDPNNWAVTLQAGYDFGNHVVQNGVGSIYLNGGVGLTQSGAIETSQGNITLQAGHDVLVGSGYVRTGGGGNISVTAGDGDVDSGTKRDVYDYTRSGYVISALGLGGIGTANGGNVSVTAGRDILSFTANIGAFGAAAGNVNLSAGRDLKGKFLVRNGVGAVLAGRDIGAASLGASFGLIAGGWNIEAARDAFINEIYNPNGALNANGMVVPAGVYAGNLNSAGSTTTPTVRQSFLFDYALDAFAHITGHNSVSLTGGNLARTSGNSARPAIYAPILEIIAGAGGVTLGSDVILFPSAQGYLDITTTAGGALRSLPGKFSQLIVSDSALPDYTTFAAGHGVTPVHAGATAPVLTLDIAGNLENVFIRAPGSADIRVHGNVLNAAFEGQNLVAGAPTRFLIDGNYFSRSDRTSVVLSDNAAAAFERIFNDPHQVLNATLANRLDYDPATHTLTIQGIMTVADLNFLLNPTRYIWTPDIGLHLNPDGTPVVVADTLTTDAAALSQLSAATQDIPTSSLARLGFQIGGPGTFQFAANNLDLGISSGIRSVGTLNNRALAGISAQGADISMVLAGNLDMTSSQIASFNGGSISILAGGHMNIGSQQSFTSDNTPKGIYTGHGGSITLHAGGDVLVNGSRIASYDGGNVWVTAGIPSSKKDGSQVGWDQVVHEANGILYVVDAGGGVVRDKLTKDHSAFDATGNGLTDEHGNEIHGYLVTLTGGSVDAGSGRNGFFQVTTSEFNPLTGQVEIRNTPFFGSGIMAFTRNDSAALVGDLVVNAGQDILGGSSGYLQIPFNTSPHAGRVLSLLAERDILVDSSGILGVEVHVDAAREITGKVVGSDTVDLRAETLKVTALGPSVTSSGDSSTSTLIGQSVSTSDTGDGGGGQVITTGGEGGAGNALAGVAAPAATKTVETADKAIAAATATADDEDEQKKKRGAGNGAVLAQKTSRVTVILPKKS